jgi:hypothetical protein
LLLACFFVTAGNCRLRELIAAHTLDYLTADSKSKKGQIILDMIQQIQNDSPTGVGLVKMDQSTRRWSFIGQEKAKDKIGHALRKASQELQKEKKKNRKTPKESASKKRKEASSSSHPPPPPSSPERVTPHPATATTTFNATTGGEVPRYAPTMYPHYPHPSAVYHHHHQLQQQQQENRAPVLQSESSSSGMYHHPFSKNYPQQQQQQQQQQQHPDHSAPYAAAYPSTYFHHAMPTPFHHDHRHHYQDPRPSKLYSPI